MRKYANHPLPGMALIQCVLFVAGSVGRKWSLRSLMRPIPPKYPDAVPAEIPPPGAPRELA